MRESFRGEIQPMRTGKGRLHHCLKWGILFAGLYLVVSLPCSVAYLGNRHEYNIRMTIVYYASFPVYHVLFQTLRPVTLPIERLPYGEALGFSFFWHSRRYFISWSVRVWDR